MPKLIFDIETIGENFDELDSATQRGSYQMDKKIPRARRNT